MTRPVIAPLDLVFLGQHPEDEPRKVGLARPGLTVSFRTVPPSLSDPTLLRWQREGRRVYFTAGSSDFVAWQDEPLFVSARTGLDALARPTTRALYLHEIVAFFAHENGWKWPAAVKGVPWDLIDRWVLAAKRRGKRVVWSEPSHGWEAILRDPTFGDLWPAWRGALAPAYATNFRATMPFAVAGARRAAARLRSPLGASVQSWHFRTVGETPTAEATRALLEEAAGNGARILQIEGRPDDADWGSAFMAGVSSFAARD